MNTYLIKLSEQGKGLFWVLSIATILVIYAMQITGNPLRNEVAPAGIVSFELTGSLKGSLEIMNSWEGEALGWAKINMGLDFLFLTCYALTIALACLLVGHSLRESWPRIWAAGRWFALAIMIAASLDVIENLALIGLLAGWQVAFLPVLAKWSAIPKFGLVAVSLAYVILGLILFNVSKFTLQRQDLD